MQQARDVLGRYELQPVHNLVIYNTNLKISNTNELECQSGLHNWCKLRTVRHPCPSYDRLVKLPVHPPQERLQDVLLAQDPVLDVKQGRVDAVTDPVFAIWLKTTAHEAGQGRDGPVFRFEVVVECAQVVRY